MIHRVAGIMMFGVWAAVAAAQVTPLDAELKPGATTMITCEYRGGGVKTVDWVCTPTKGLYHYRLYVPPGYQTDGKERYGAMVFFSPEGDADPWTARQWLKQERVFGISLVESKNGPSEPIIGNFLSAFDDARARVRIADGFIFMTGMSGGARSTTLAASLRRGCAGIILQAAGFIQGNGHYLLSAFRPNPGLMVYGIFGLRDFNAPEMPEMAKVINSPQLRCSVFDGEHEYAPREQMLEALDYLQRWVYLKKATDDKAMDMYQAKFLQWHDQAVAAQGWAEYNWLEKAQKLAQARNLSADKDLKDPIDLVNKTLADLAKDEDIVRELAARDLYTKTRDAEDFAQMKQWGTPELRKSLQTAQKGYQEVVDKCGQTYWATRAESRLAVLKVEMD